MLKQNVPGFFGVGTALKHFEESGRWDKIQELFEQVFVKNMLRKVPVSCPIGPIPQNV